MRTFPVGELILVSKTAYGESMPIYLRTKHFMFCNRHDMERFIHFAGPFQRDYITNSVFGIDDLRDEEAVKVSQLVAKCTALRKLSIVAYSRNVMSAIPHRYRDIEQLAGSTGFKILAGLRNVASVRICPGADTTTLLFALSAEYNVIHEDLSAFGRLLISRARANPKPPSQNTRISLLPPLDSPDQTLTMLHGFRYNYRYIPYDFPDGFVWQRQRGTISYRSASPGRGTFIYGESLEGVPIYNNES